MKKRLDLLDFRENFKKNELEEMKELKEIIWNIPLLGSLFFMMLFILGFIVILINILK